MALVACLVHSWRRPGATLVKNLPSPKWLIGQKSPSVQSYLMLINQSSFLRCVVTIIIDKPQISHALGTEIMQSYHPGGTSHCCGVKLRTLSCAVVVIILTYVCQAWILWFSSPKPCCAAVFNITDVFWGWTSWNVSDFGGFNRFWPAQTCHVVIVRFTTERIPWNVNHTIRLMLSFLPAHTAAIVRQITKVSNNLVTKQSCQVRILNLTL